ncbi:MAG: bifunctional folylpolyglutamate synthase/dihydrofolate synthase [Rickettsiaceae bacterium H1]|nr:bifunctional folylpolyglutamate synthase/dihydrofolate synthase [Rickettsiaceae bacterium H1]
MPHWPKPLGKRPIKYNLENVSKLLKRLDHPEKKIPPVIHVAGTNGKGSTIAFMKRVLIESGYKVHVYISPHLVYFNERITLANDCISSPYLYDILEECRYVSSDMEVTFFEGTTAAAFLAFSKVKADVVLIETGMGGRLDATNVIQKPLLTVITPISLDHQECLGNSIELIAAEKAGIIKRDSTCIISEQEELARKVLESYAIKRRSHVYRKGFEWNCMKQNNQMIFESAQEEIELPLPSLEGEHQIINAGTAIAALTILAKKYNYEIDYRDMVGGITDTKWPARLEKITSGKLADLLPEAFEIFFDGAHNIAGAKAIANWAKKQNKEIYLIVGMTKDRDTQSFLMLLKPIIKFLFCVCVQSEPRSQTARSIHLSATKIGINAKECESLTSAFNEIKNLAKEGIVLICGSLFLAGDVLKQNW